MSQVFYDETAFRDSDRLTRNGAVNALFSAFADKTLAYEYNHIVSLYLFDHMIEKKCDFIKDMNLFIELVDGATPRG